MAGVDAEQPLDGGNMGTVSRLGDEVRRPAGEWTANVHRLLQCYAAAGIDGVPRPLGDEHVAPRDPDAAWPDRLARPSPALLSHTDAELLDAHVAGDPDAFSALVRRHYDYLWRLAIRTSFNRDDAAEALQEALMSAYRKAVTFRHACPVQGWLYRIVVNAFAPNRSQRRCWKKWSHLHVRMVDLHFSEEHFALYRRYIESRHADGAMANDTEEQYQQFFLRSAITSFLVEFRDAHGVLRMVLELDGEIIERVDPHVGLPRVLARWLGEVPRARVAAFQVCVNL